MGYGAVAFGDVDVSTPAARTAAAQNLRMIESEIVKHTAVARAARAKGQLAVVLSAQNEIQALSDRARQIEIALYSQSPLSGLGNVGGFSTGLAFGAPVVNELAALEAERSKVAAEIRAIAAKISPVMAQLSQIDKELPLTKDPVARAALTKRAEALRGELKTQQAAMEALKLKLKYLDEKIAKVRGVAVDPARTVAQLEAEIAALRVREAGVNKQIAAADPQRKSAFIPQLTQVRAEIQKKLEELAKAKAVLQAGPKGGTSTTVVVSGPPTASVPANNAAAKIAADQKEVEQVIAAIRKQLEGAPNFTAFSVHVAKMRDLHDSIRNNSYSRDSLVLGADAARKNRLMFDQARMSQYNTLYSAAAVAAKKLPAPADQAKLIDFVKSLILYAQGKVEESKKALLAAVPPPPSSPPPVVSPNQLSNVKNQISLSPGAAIPSNETILSLARGLQKLVPQRTGESLNDYVLRFKRYLGRAVIYFANARVKGVHELAAAGDAVRTVISKDGAAIEEEAAKKIQAPAGEQAVAANINALDDKLKAMLVVKPAAPVSPPNPPIQPPSLVPPAMPPGPPAPPIVAPPPAPPVLPAAPPAPPIVVEAPPAPPVVIDTNTLPQTDAPPASDAPVAASSDAGAPEEVPFWKTPIGMLSIGVGAIFLVKKLRS